MNIQFKQNFPIKLWIWYNGLLEAGDAKKAHLIGLVGSHKALERLYNQFKADNIMITDKTVDFLVIFIHHRLKYLNKSMKKQTSNNQISKKDFKRAFGPQSTKKIISHVEKGIKNKYLRKDTIAFIKAVDGKKIRNTSGV